MKTHEITLAIATILTALMSGFFFSYSFSVNLGLNKLDNRSYLMAMQNINREVLNPIFYLCFFGALIFLIVSSILYFDMQSPKFYLILFACISYAFGVFAVTGIRNVPLNNQLDVFIISKASEASIQNMRGIFEDAWVFWNSIRTWASFIAVVCLIVGIVFFGTDSKS